MNIRAQEAVQDKGEMNMTDNLVLFQARKMYMECEKSMRQSEEAARVVYSFYETLEKLDPAVREKCMKFIRGGKLERVSIDEFLAREEKDIVR